MDQIFKRILGHNFSELKGSTVLASIVLPESLINEILRSALQGNNNIESLQIAIHPQNRVALSVKTALLPWSLQLKLKIDRSIDLASYSSPKLRAWMENNRWLGTLGSLFDALPEGTKLFGNQIVVDLAAFLPSPEHKPMLDLVKSVDIRTEPSTVILDVKAAVER
ncbi:MAG TPA: hypothetical protein VK900_06440 [Anaerolineales bacterium]|nr:hypothetical protein [Anaerolineales bacterium]